MTRRTLAVPLALGLLLLVGFGRLAADPSALIVDPDRPGVDANLPKAAIPRPGNDLTRLFLPHHLAISRSIARLGRVPRWDDRGFGGRPLVGNPQAGLFYPPTWLAWRSGEPSTLGWITVGHLLFAGLGAYRLCRTLKLGGFSGVVAAGCFQMSPYVMAQVFEGHYPHVWAASWYPWAFDAAIRLRAGDRRSGLLLAPILAMMALAGHPQEVYYLAVALGIWTGYEGIRLARSGRQGEAIRLGAAWAVVLILALGMVAVEAVPDGLAGAWGLRFARHSLRAADGYHLRAIDAVRLLGPFALGGPSDYVGRDNYWETVASIGLVPLALATIGATCSGPDRSARGWSWLVIGSLAFASGRALGVFALLYELLPGLDRFRVPARSLFLASLGASILAGYGAEALRRRAGDADLWRMVGRRWLVLASILAVVVGSWRLAGSPLPPGEGPGVRGAARPMIRNPGDLESRSPGDAPHPNPLPGGEGAGKARITDAGRLEFAISRLSADPTFWLGLGGLTVGLMVGLRRPDWRPAVAAGLGLLALGELAWDARALIVTSPAGRFLGPDPISGALLGDRAGRLEPSRIRAVDWYYGDLRAGLAGFSKANVNDSFQVQHAEDLYGRLYGLFGPDRPVARDGPMDRAVLDHERAVRLGVLDRMAVSWLVLDRLEGDDPRPLVGSGFWEGSTYSVRRNPTALPRAYVVPRAEVAADRPSVVERFGDVDPREAVLMPSDPLGAPIGPRQPFTPAEWASADPDRPVLRVATEAPGLLVVADTWMPGWSAEVDGRPEPVLKGNRAQRVVPLREAGRHEVVLRYRAPGLASGMIATAVSVACWLVAILGLRRSSRRAPGPIDPGGRNGPSLD